MCISSPKIEPQKPKPLPRAPTVDDDAVRARARQEQAELAARAGRSATVVSSDLAATPTVQRRVLLGQ